MKRAFVTDSTIYLGEEYVKENNINIIPLSVNFEDESFTETGDLGVLNRKVFAKIDKEKIIPKSSQPTTQSIIELFEQLLDDQYEEIVVFTLSSSLSGTYQGVCLAKNEVLEKYPDAVIHVIDTKMSAQASGFIVHEVVRQQKLNEQLLIEEIDEIAEFYIKNTRVYVIVDDLKYFVYGGRVDPKVAAIGNLLSIKPMLHLVDGKLEEYKKVRSLKLAIKQVMNLLEEDLAKYETIHVTTTHVSKLSLATKIDLQIKNQFEDQLQSHIISDLGPVISVHAGPGAVGVIWAPTFEK